MFEPLGKKLLGRHACWQTRFLMCKFVLVAMLEDLRKLTEETKMDKGENKHILTCDILT